MLTYNLEGADKDDDLKEGGDLDTDENEDEEDGDGEDEEVV